MKLAIHSGSKYARMSREVGFQKFQTQLFQMVAMVEMVPMVAKVNASTLHQQVLQTLSEMIAKTMQTILHGAQPTHLVHGKLKISTMKPCAAHAAVAIMAVTVQT